MATSLTTTLSSPTKTVEINRNLPTVMIGERINPTGRKKVLAALKEGNLDVVRKDAADQVAAGAKVLDVNAGVPGADEPALMRQVVQAVMEVTDVPLCIDTANPEVLKAALEMYQGKALVNSVNGEERSLSAILPLVAEHGCAVIGLCMDDNGIPPTAADRLAVAQRILERAAKHGIAPDDVIIDPLTLTLGADHLAGRVALETVALVAQELGNNVTMGASNVSFGMPDRKHINSAFLTMAIHAGVTCPITNPLEEEIATAVLAADLVMGRDEYGSNWIKAYRDRQKALADG